MSFGSFGWGAPLPVQLDGSVTDEYVTKSTTQSITGEKTFDSEALVVNDLKLANGSVMTFPTGGDDEVVTLAATQTITGPKRFLNEIEIYGTTDANPFRGNLFLVSGGWGSTKTTLTTDQTTDVLLYLPSANGTIALASQIPSVSSLVTGPASAVDNRIATYNGTTGKLIKDSGVATTNIPNQTVNTTSSPTFATQTLTTGLLLPTTGGTPTSLNYYEDGTFNLTFTGPFTKTVACAFVRIGKLVNFNMNWSANQASAGGFFTTNGLPARLAPFIAVDCQIWVTDNSVVQAVPGRIVVAGTNISIYRTQVAANFTAAGLAAFNNWSWTWTVA